MKLSFLFVGLNLIGSVCDQPNQCVKALNDLIHPDSDRALSTGELLVYNANGNSIIHMYDYPHIWKTLRNNFMVKDLRHSLTKR